MPPHVPIRQPPFSFFLPFVSPRLVPSAMTARINLQCKELHGKNRRGGCQAGGDMQVGKLAGQGTSKSPQNTQQPAGVQGAAAARRDKWLHGRRADEVERRPDLQFRLGSDRERMRASGSDACMKYRLPGSGQQGGGGTGWGAQRVNRVSLRADQILDARGGSVVERGCVGQGGAEAR